MFLQRKRDSVARGSQMGICLSDINMVAMLTAWPTPQAGSPATETYNEAGNTDYSRRVVELSSWPTTTTRDWKDGSEQPNVERNALLGREVWLASWPTPQSQDGSGGGQAKRATEEARHGSNLNDFAMLALNGPARMTHLGALLTGCSAGTASGGQLNPEHSRWLQGYPPEWASCAPTETRSSRSKPRSSSKPSLKRAKTCDDLFG